MKKLKLFPKIFLYTFFVMLFITVAAHVFLYLFAPQMMLSVNNSSESGVLIESSLNAKAIIREAIFQALPISLACSTIVSALCSLLFSKAMTRPIKQISKTTGLRQMNLANGDL